MCRRGALAPGVRRYVLLTQSRGGTRCPAPNAVNVGVFLHSWCDAGLCGIYFILAFAKTPDRSGQAVTPVGSPPGGGVVGRGANHKTVLLRQQIVAPRSGNCI